MTMSADVRSMSQSVKAAGGVVIMQTIIINAQSLSQSNKEILDNCREILQNGEKEELRQNNKGQKSASNKEFHDEMKTYESVFHQAQLSDEFIVEKFERHRKFIELLCDSKSLQQELDRCSSQQIFLTNLGDAHKAFNELKNHLNENMKFHQDLSKLILTMKGKFLNFYSVRLTGIGASLPDLQQNIPQINPSQEQTDGPCLVPPPAMRQGVAPAPTQAMSQGASPAPTQAMSQGASPAPTQAMMQGFAPAPQQAMSQQAPPLAMRQGASPAPTQAMSQGAALAPTQAKTMSPKQPEILSDKVIYYVASQLGIGWQQVAVNLGLQHVQLEKIKLNQPHDTTQQIVSALMKWRDDDSLGRVATDSSNEEKLAELFDALTEANRTDLVNDVKRKFNFE